MAEIKVDKWDIIIACSSGALSGAVDNILCTDFGWDKAHDLGEDDVTFFIKKITKEENLKKAVFKLEREYKNKSDEEIQKYINEHWDEVPLPDGEYVPESDKPDFDNFEIEEDE